MSNTNSNTSSCYTSYRPVAAENWDDECEQFPKLYVGNFKPAQSIFSSSDKPKECADQTKHIPGLGNPTAHSRPSGRAHRSSRGEKRTETKQGGETGKYTYV